MLDLLVYSSLLFFSLFNVLMESKELSHQTPGPIWEKWCFYPFILVPIYIT